MMKSNTAAFWRILATFCAVVMTCLVTPPVWADAQSVARLAVSPQTLGLLSEANVKTVDRLMELSFSEISQIVGQAQVTELREAIAALGYQVGGVPGAWFPDILSLKLSPQAYNSLILGQVLSIVTLSTKSEEELRRIVGLNDGTLQEIRDSLRSRGLSLRPNFQDRQSEFNDWGLLSSRTSSALVYAKLTRWSDITALTRGEFLSRVILPKELEVKFDQILKERNISFMPVQSLEQSTLSESFLAELRYRRIFDLNQLLQHTQASLYRMGIPGEYIEEYLSADGLHLRLSELDLATDLRANLKSSLRKAGYDSFSQLEQLYINNLRIQLRLLPNAVKDLNLAMAARGKGFRDNPSLHHEIQGAPELSQLTRNVLRDQQIETIEQLALKSRKTLTVVPGLGAVGRAQIKDLLEAKDLHLYNDLVERAIVTGTPDRVVDWGDLDIGTDLARVLRKDSDLNIKTIGDLIRIGEDRVYRSGLNGHVAEAMDRFAAQLRTYRVSACRATLI